MLVSKVVSCLLVLSLFFLLSFIAIPRRWKLFEIKIVWYEAYNWKSDLKKAAIRSAQRRILSGTTSSQTLFGRWNMNENPLGKCPGLFWQLINRKVQEWTYGIGWTVVISSLGSLATPRTFAELFCSKLPKKARLRILSTTVYVRSDCWKRRYRLRNEQRRTLANSHRFRSTKETFRFPVNN